MNSRDRALELVARGWWVFPVPPNEKQAWEGWTEVSSNDPVFVLDQWPEDTANIGVHCGPSNLLVLDIDYVGTFKEMA